MRRFTLVSPVSFLDYHVSCQSFDLRRCRSSRRLKFQPLRRGVQCYTFSQGSRSLRAIGINHTIDNFTGESHFALQEWITLVHGLRCLFCLSSRRVCLVLLKNSKRHLGTTFLGMRNPFPQACFFLTGAFQPIFVLCFACPTPTECLQFSAVAFALRSTSV